MEVVEYGFQQASIAFQTGLVDLHPAVGRSLGKKIGRGKRRVAEEILLAGIAALRACSGRLGRLNIDGRSLGRGDGGDRKSGVEGKSVSVRVDIGGRRIN